ncbi:MAG: tRNA lysidine(34) synthetase TilS [Lachnospiraceae bacterium]|nr:tRNA lysidine(34) synthetase TilS [Lachnospiraceae bacterium]
MKEQELTRPGDRVLVGLSGGADSVCLLLVLCRLAERFSLSLGAFHVHHGIRGEEADRDEAFSEGLCKEYGIEFYSVKESVPDRAKEWHMGLEEAGRKVRQEAAKDLMERYGYTKIALAHHQNDVAETVLFHLFRGSSVSGLASIPAKRENLIRPLLSCDREEIESYLKERQIAYCTDSTNLETEYTRNKIRHEILDYTVKEINPGAVRHIGELAAACAELESFLEAETEQVMKSVDRTPEGAGIPADLLKARHAVLQKRVIHRLIGSVAGSKKDITKDHVEAVLGLFYNQSGRKVSLPYGLEARREFDRVVIGTGTEAGAEGAKGFGGNELCIIPLPGEFEVSFGEETLYFCTFSCEKNAQIPKNEYTKWFDYDKIKGTLCVRTYREGDRMGLLSGSKAVKTVWTERKVPVWRRKTQPLVADEAQVLWIPGVRCCDNYRVDETTKTVLEIRRNGGKTDGSECKSSDIRG